MVYRAERNELGKTKTQTPADCLLPMSHDDDPLSLRSIGIRPLQVRLEPLVLEANLIPAKLSEVVKFGAEHDNVGGTDVHRVKVIVQSSAQGGAVVRVGSVGDHRKASVVVAESGKRELSCFN